LSENTKKTDPEQLEEESWSDIAGEDASRLLKGLEAMIPGILRRSIISGLNTALSEEGFRGAVSEKNIPKEAVGFVLSQADNTRREILRIVSREVRTFLENVDFGGEIAKILTTLSFEIRTEVRFIPNDEALKPNIRNRVKIKRIREDGKEETVNEFEDETPPDDAKSKDKKSSETKRPSTPESSPKSDSGKRRWTRRRNEEDT
jgi:hypothetical protein